VLRIEGLTKSYGARTLMAGVSLHVHPGDRIGLVGRNGEGKTTLLRMLAGLEAADDGRVIPRRGARVGYLRQEVDPTSDRRLIEEVRTVHAPLREMESQLRALEHEISALGGKGGTVPDGLAHRYDELSERFKAAGGFEAESELRAILTGLGIGPDRWERPLHSFSGGWLMRVELAKLLLARPEVLLLDEPTNHLDIPSIRWFEGVLAGYPGAVVVVSHDRTFLDRHATRIAELAQGRLTVYNGNYSAYLEQKGERELHVRARRETLDRQIAHAQKFVDRFGAKATKASQAESRKKKIAKLRTERDALVVQVDRRRLRFRFRAVPRSGDIVLRMEGVAKAYSETRVYDSLDLELRRGDRVALVGPNGAGKSTLLRLAAGTLAPDRGTRELGHGVAAAFYAQHQLEALDMRRTVLEEIQADAALDEIPRLRTLLGSFLFSGDDVQKKVSVLSGGEKARLALAKLLLGSANFLILDEPTNHLDLQARDIVSDALSTFDGTLLFISHDRSLINRLANQVIEVSPGAESASLRHFPGGYDDYTRSLEQESAPAEPRPARTRAPGRKRPDTGQSRSRRKRERELRERVEQVERKVEAAEQELERLGWLSADPALVRDGERMREIELSRRAARGQLDELYTEWERLSGELDALAQVDLS
jgi:ATP-binding cassette subfamily F protein 3